jgi:5-oxopent-3-ene-1,2,5-tricarboxylate decarboxylase/2-hydroxyhepta-2,4-diene-1,7-dioate isomerase
MVPSWARLDVSPFRLSGTVYGALLNHSSALEALGPAVNAPPYSAPPRAPVLYIKPRNTLAGPGHAVEVPAGCDALEIGACLGVVVGRTASRLTPGAALDHVAGYLIVDDISLPHASYYRPSLRFRARDGFCPMSAFVPRAAVWDPDCLTIDTFVDDVRVASASTAGAVRKVAQLLADVTEFMTLAPGDVLATGVAAPAPQARAGQAIRIEITSLGSLRHTLVEEGA